MIILRQKEFARKKRRRLKDNSDVEDKIVNGRIENSSPVSDSKTKRALIEDDLSKVDNTGIYHGDQKIKDEDKLTAKDKEKVRKAVKKGQMYIEFDK
jgi:hypothetical protein